jgi:hypothetical protein
VQNYNKGIDFEDYIEKVYRLLLILETNKDEEPAVISRNVKLLRNGYTDEIDILYEFVKARVRHRVAIECKNHSSPIAINQIRDFHAKISKSQNITGVFISNSGFQSGTKSYALEHDIILMTTDDLPNFFNLVGKRLKQIFLPSEHTMGEPFYVLMEHNKGELTGSYHITRFDQTPDVILLFLSKKMANEYVIKHKEIDLTPRSLKKESYNYIILLAKKNNVQFQLLLMYNDSARENCYSLFIEPDDLKSEFYE